MNLATSQLERDAAAVPADRDVDWRIKAQEIQNSRERRAAYGQRCGMIVPVEQSCYRCQHGKGGVFASCVVNVVNGEPQFGGACMNCSWPRGAARCTFRK